MKTPNRLAAALIAPLWLTALACPAEGTTAPPAQQAAAEASLAQEAFPPEQIEQLVAPIALYPDALLAQILMASTYPLDLVQAKRWLDGNQGLEGEELQTAADGQTWDPSVKTLVFFPDVLGFMSDNLDWTQDLGDAVLGQQDDVTVAVQTLRRQAEEAGNLESNEQQRIETQGDTIIVQPAEPEVVYVPSYAPAAVYNQPQPATTYYPATYTEPAYVAPASTASGSSSDGLVGFGVGAVVGGLLTAAILWDDDDYNRIYYGGPGYYGRPGYWNRPNYWNDGWRKPEIDIDRSRVINTGDITVNRGLAGSEIKKWEHNPERRGGVRYRNTEVKQKFDRDRVGNRIDRDAARGRERLARGDVQLPARGELRRPERPGKSEIKRPEKLPAKRPEGLKDKVAEKRTAPRPAQRPARAPEVREIRKPAARAERAPVKRDVKRPQAPKARSAAASRDRDAFKVRSGKMDRAASKRGAKSRSRGAGRGERRSKGRRG